MSKIFLIFHCLSYDSPVLQNAFNLSEKCKHCKICSNLSNDKFFLKNESLDVQ